MGETVEVMVPEKNTLSPAAGALLALKVETDQAFARLVPLPEPAPDCVT